MILPNIWKITNVPNYQPVIIPLQKKYIWGIPISDTLKNADFQVRGHPKSSKSDCKNILKQPFCELRSPIVRHT
jgi:hypothetical protein